MNASLVNLKPGTMRGAIAMLVIGAALVAVRPAHAATSVPAHQVSAVKCFAAGSQMEMLAELPSWMYSGRDRNGYQYRSEPVTVRFSLLEKVNGVWKYITADDQYFTNYATSGGVLQSGWLPNGNSSSFGASGADFYISRGGEFRLAMEIWWSYSGSYVYEWAGRHYYFDTVWGFERDTPTCRLY